jgi:MarR family 2-MHQ and catechol resistance regulon transcriptional repressor
VSPQASSNEIVARSRSATDATGRAATLALVIALARAHRALERAVRPNLAECGLGLSEFAVLEALLHKGPLTLGEIRERILITGPSITYVVKKLETRGLLQRVPDPDDQRTVLAELTADGRQLIAHVFPEHAEQLDELMAGLSVNEKRTAIRLLRRLAADSSAGAPVEESD